MKEDIFEEISNEEIKKFLENAVAKGFEKVLLKYGLINKLENPETRHVTIGMLARELSICRQTIHNWKKHPNTKKLIAIYTKQEGKKTLYDLEKIKKLIRENPAYFSNGRDHKYREEVMSDREKKRRVLNEIAAKIDDTNQVTEEERLYYNEEKATNDEEKRPSNDYNPDLVCR